MAARGVQSPDIADALAMTFAEEVAPMAFSRGDLKDAALSVVSDYDPMEDKF